MSDERNAPTTDSGASSAATSRRIVVLTVGHYLALVAFAFLAGMLLAALVIGTYAGKVGV